MQGDDIKNWIRTELFDQVPVRICVIDRQFGIVEANQSFSKTYGTWQGRRCHQVYKGRSSRCENCAAARTFADGKLRVREERGVVREGRQTYYLVHMLPLQRESGEVPYVIEMSTDITDLKALEREKLEAERLAAVGQTVAGLAHGVKNVLMGLEGGMYVVNSGLQNGDSGRIGKGWQMLEQNVERITVFVKEFLEFARGRVPQVAPADPNEIARKVVELFRDKAALSGIVLNCHCQDDVENANMDAEAIHTCLTNLVSNALDACEVSDPDREHHVNVATRDRDDTLIFEVEDDGCGMDYEISRKVFSSFFSTKAIGKGTGLGLLTTKKIVHEHGGAVSFESKEGEGSVFRLTFPRKRLPVPEDDKGRGSVVEEAI